MLVRRARSPLRWLWVVTSVLSLVVVAGVAGTVWVLLAAPVAALAILFAPPLGVFRHDETPIERAGCSLECHEILNAGLIPPGGRRFVVTMINSGGTSATGFRIRILIPSAIWPRGTSGSPLARPLVGQLGRHWFVESVYDDASVTFRAGDPAEDGAVTCPAQDSLDLAELVLVNLAFFERGAIEYQINGGSVSTVLGRLRLPTGTPTEEPVR